MTTDLTIHVADTAGELGRVGQALGLRGVNIQGLCSVGHGGATAEVHVLVEEAGPAFAALEAAGIEVSSEREVLVVEARDRPGELGDIAQKLGDADVNIDLIYLATSTRLVIAADDLHKARLVLE